MIQKENLTRLVIALNIPEENISSLWPEYEGEIERWAICYELRDEYKENVYWVEVYGSMDEALTTIEESHSDDEHSRWKPIYIVDLLDLSTREISIEVRVGLGELLENSY